MSLTLGQCLLTPLIAISRAEGSATWTASRAAS
jgi:hypothetical protein